MILGIEASPRKGGNSHQLVSAVLAGAKSAGQVVLPVHLRDYKYEPCSGCEKCRKDKICTHFNDGMGMIYPEFLMADGLVLVSPVHNYNITSWMKAFIDRLYCFYDFEDTRPRSWSSRLAGQGRKAVIACIAEQTKKKDAGVALEAMRLPLIALGYEIVEETTVLGLFDRGAVTGNKDAMDWAEKAGKILARAL